jgi:hypothetical protein
MSAFNWIKLKTKCPICSENTFVLIQLHIAASFQSGGKGRFCNLTYSVGDRLNWWSEDCPEFSSWTVGGLDVPDAPQSVRECCYAQCDAHNDRLYTVVQVSNLKIDKIVELGPEEQWPLEYPK